jgi:hypothetical protein
MNVTKAADLNDTAVVDAVRRAAELRRAEQASRWDIACALAGYAERVGTSAAVDPVEGLPAKVLLAKLRKLVRRGLVEGCVCGCRGSFVAIERPAADAQASHQRVE